MEKIVLSLLEAERLNSRHAQLTRTDVDVNALVGTLIEDFFTRDKHRLALDLPAEPLSASLDEARISLLLKNLVSNALRYSNEADGPVTIAASRRDGELVLSVSDHGPGMSQEQAEHIGEPFYRPDPSRTRSPVARVWASTWPRSWPPHMAEN